jgi:hypothetical protein
VKSRYEKERLDFITGRLNFSYKKIIDIGGNTGFFSIELANNYKARIDYYEGNKSHADFVKCATEMLGIEHRIKVQNEYFVFNDSQFKKDRYDICLLLNVSHHIGDDFGDQHLSIDNAKKQMIEDLNYLSDKTQFLVFQMGYCWKGNKDLLLFKEGTKKEMIDFVKQGTKGFWNIEETGIAELQNNEVTYKPVNDHNIKRDDALGEFLNRPLFIMKTLKSK